MQNKMQFILHFRDAAYLRVKLKGSVKRANSQIIKQKKGTCLKQMPSGLVFKYVDEKKFS
jgi:hypothetical protein